MAVAVFDVGKTNLKVSIADRSGRVVESLSTPNRSWPGPPYRHHDLAATEDWLLDRLTQLGRRHPIEAIVTCAHGSGGVLVGADGPAMPMIDYEQTPPAAIEAEYRRIAGSFEDRGSAVMLGAAHLGRQMLWLERDYPGAFASASAFVATPQYWAWRLSGVLASEVTSLAAQSHIWSSAKGHPARLVAERGWERLMPPLQPAWATLGPLRRDFVVRTGLGHETRVLCGIHDSTANLYRYQAAGLSNFTVMSTGTWIVAISDHPGPDLKTEQPGLCCNADVHGRPLPCILTMGGREFSAVLGEARGLSSPEAIGRLVSSDTMALPSFGSDDGLFPDTAGRGRVDGPLADDPDIRPSLAVLYAALLTDRCLDGLDIGKTIVVDGSFGRDPLFASLIAALHPDTEVLVARDQNGTAAGAALLATHETRRAPAPLDLDRASGESLPDLRAYRARWREKAQPKETVA